MCVCCVRVGTCGRFNWKHPVRPVREESQLLCDGHGAEEQRTSQGEGASAVTRRVCDMTVAKIYVCVCVSP